MQTPGPKHPRAASRPRPRALEPASTGHQTLGDELYGELRSRDLTLKAVSAFVLAATALFFDIGVLDFILLYALQVGFAMFVTAPFMFFADQRDKAEGVQARDIAVFVAVMAGFWGIAVLLPLWSLWGATGQDVDTSAWSAWSALPWAEMSLPAFVFLATAVAAGWRYARLPAAQRAQISLHRPVIERALCIIAFIVFGPTVYAGLLSFGEFWPSLAVPVNAVILTYALAEAYPFLATLVDRIPAGRRRPE